MQSLGERNAEWTIGSLAQVIARDLEGQIILPEWGSEIPLSGVRDVAETVMPMSSVNVVPGHAPVVVSTAKAEKKKEKKVWKDLDKFYASESESEDEEEEEEEEEESEEESEEEEEAGEEEGSEEESEEETDEEEERQMLRPHNQWR